MYGGLSGAPDLADAVLGRPSLLNRLAALDGPVLGWGRTAGLDRLLEATGCASGSGGAALRAVRTWESKAAANALFHELADGDPAIAVPAQQRYRSPGEAVRAAIRRARRGESVVLKTEYGVGGSGAVVVTPRSARGGARALRRRLSGAGETLVEDLAPASGPYRDVTADAVVDSSGAVFLVGVGVMDVEGTSYAGALVGPGVLPAGLERAAAGFCLRVGRALAADGHRGWFDVDLVAGPTGRLAPTEVNCRVTGPAVAFTIQARLEQVHGGRWLVRTFDRLPLGTRVSEDLLHGHLSRLTRACASWGAVLVPTILSSSYADDPTFGVALAARDRTTLRLASAFVSSETAALGRDLMAHC